MGREWKIGWHVWVKGRVSFYYMYMGHAFIFLTKLKLSFQEKFLTHNLRSKMHWSHYKQSRHYLKSQFWYNGRLLDLGVHVMMRAVLVIVVGCLDIIFWHFRFYIFVLEPSDIIFRHLNQLFWHSFLIWHCSQFCYGIILSFLGVIASVWVLWHRFHVFGLSFI